LLVYWHGTIDFFQIQDFSAGEFFINLFLFFAI